MPAGNDVHEADAEAPAADRGEHEQTPVPSSAGPPRLPRILVVDDRPEHLLALEAVLDPLGVHIVRATTAADALVRVDEDDFALILLDVRMPGTDGLEAARRIKARERGRVVPILFMTALEHDRRRVTTAYQAGAVDYLFKPLDPDELRAKVTAFLDLHRLQEEERERRRRYADRLVHSSEERYRRAAEQAEEARAALETAHRAKTEFLSRMSHELRTPLNAILGYVQLLDLGILGGVTPEQHTHLNRVRQSAVHLLGLVNEILDLVVLDSAGLAVAREVMHVGEACEAALALVRIEASQRNLTVVGLASDDPGALYIGDPNRVRQVLVHLLTNAVKFTPPGGQVTVTCGTTDGREATADGRPGPPGPGRWAYVRVTDTGIGIGAAQLPSIFDAFTQLDGGRTRTADGAGLGLTISRRLARAMDGDVTAWSAPDHGSVFTLWLPTPDASADEVDTTARPSTALAGTPSIDAAASGLDESPPPPRTYRGVAALGTALASEIEAIVQQHGARLRADRSIPNVDGLPDAQLRDHTSTLVTELAHVVTVIGQTEGRAPELLRDGSEILRLVSELHGTQRHRLGWDEAHFAGEIDLLHAEIEAALRRAAARGTADNDALEQTLVLIRRVLEQSRLMSLRGFHRARHDDVG